MFNDSVYDSLFNNLSLLSRIIFSDNVVFFHVQYFKPYMSADLNKMAVAFNTSVAHLEDELTQLILDDQISARIDSHAKVKN